MRPGVIATLAGERAKSFELAKAPQQILAIQKLTPMWSHKAEIDNKRKK